MEDQINTVVVELSDLLSSLSAALIEKLGAEEAVRYYEALIIDHMNQEQGALMKTVVMHAASHGCLNSGLQTHQIN